jgi:hypothetical protein
MDQRPDKIGEYGPLGGTAIAIGIDVGKMKDGKLFTLCASRSEADI